ncbi:MAG TPA: hypothetical protein VEI50_13780 [Nitrospiraceae bacterium]|nr:hypothetical protein [Nitrospiraceae bacterium]
MSIRLNWVRAIAAALVLWSSTAWGATLTWDPDPAPNLVGYRVYQCSQLPCTLTSGTASLLVTLGTVTSFSIGTPAAREYYFITAYNSSNLESSESNLAIFTPAGAPPVVLPVIGVSPTSLSFTATQGGANPATQTLNISNTGTGTLNWTASDNAAWLTLSPASGTGNGTMMLSVTTGSLTAGSYSGIVSMNATGASSVTVPVTLTVATAPVPPAIGVSPTNLTFTATQGGANPTAQTLSISNTGGGTLSWTASDNAAWLTLSRASGTGNGVVTANVVTGTTAVGTYNGTITLSATGGSSVTVPVTFIVTTTPTPPSVTPPQGTPPPTPSGLHITSVN